MDPQSGDDFFPRRLSANPAAYNDEGQDQGPRPAVNIVIPPDFMSDSDTKKSAAPKESTQAMVGLTLTDSDLEQQLEGQDAPSSPTGSEYGEPPKWYHRWLPSKDRLAQFWEANRAKFMLAFKLLLLALWIAFLSYGIYRAVAVNPEWTVIWYWLGVTVFAVVCVVLGKLSPFVGRFYNAVAAEHVNRFNEKRYAKFVYALLIAAYVLGTAFISGFGDPIRFTSAVGYAVLVALLWLFSAKRSHVNWRPVVCGYLLQYTLALVIMKTFPGRWLFQWLGDLVTTFLDCVSAGASFVFGASYKEHFFAFSVLPTLCYFAAFVAVMYHIGVMGFVIKTVAKGLQALMGTSAAETVSAVGSVFVGQSESPLMIKPFIGDMTKSEIHAIMTGGFGCVAGSVLAAYIGLGVSAEHLIAASVMAAPCGLACTKLRFPETEKPKTAYGEEFEVPRGDHDNILQAAAAGASESIPLMLNVGAMLIAFLSLLEFINQLLHSVGGCIGVPTLSVELICQYIFLPFAYLLGVQGHDAMMVAQLVGKKIILNEFVAYTDLAVFLQNRKCGLDPQISERAEVIATYALCGFANFSSIGIQIGTLTPLAPHRAKDFSRLVISAMFTGAIVSFLTANIAGFLYTPSGITYAAPFPPSCFPSNSTAPAS